MHASRKKVTKENDSPCVANIYFWAMKKNVLFMFIIVAGQDLARPPECHGSESFGEILKAHSRHWRTHPTKINEEGEDGGVGAVWSEMGVQKGVRFWKRKDNFGKKECVLKIKKNKKKSTFQNLKDVSLEGLWP